MIFKEKIEKASNNRVYCKQFFRPYEVSTHSQQGDCWIIINDRVFDLSKLTNSLSKINENTLALQQLIKFGGIDISELFESRVGLSLVMFDVKSENDYGKVNDLLWWEDPTYIIGGVTMKERLTCITKASNGQKYQMFACEEDSIYSIQKKFYEMFPDELNDHFVWRKEESFFDVGGVLVLHKTLTENGLTWQSKADVAKLWIF